MMTDNLDKVAKIIDRLGEQWDYPLAYQLLDKLHVKLSEDPVADGFHFMNAKLGRVVNYHALLSRLFRRALRNEAIAKKRVRIKEATLRREKDELISTDEEVQMGRSREDRDSIANLKLKEHHDELQQAKALLTDAECFRNCVKVTADNLQESREVVSRQFSIIQQEISLDLIGGGDFVRDRDG